MKIIQRYRESTKKLLANASARNAGWLMAGQGTGLLFQAAYFILLARLLGTSEYGLYAGAFAFTSLVAQYSALGTGTVFLRYVSPNHREFAPYWGNILITTLIVSGFLVAGLVAVSPHVLSASSTRLVLVAAIGNCLFMQLTTEIGRIFQTFEKMRITALLNLSTNIARTITALILMLTIHRATAWQWALASTSVSGLASGAAVIAVFVNFGTPEFSFSLFRKRAWEGLGFSFAASTTSAYNDIDKTMLGHYGMIHDNGVYTMAYRVIDFATMPVFAIRDAALPKLFRYGHENLPQASNYARKLLRRVMPITVGTAIVLLCCSSLIPRIVGAGFADSVYALRWLSVIPLFRCVHQMTGATLTGSGHQTARTMSQLTAAALNFGLNVWLIPRFGWRGAAWSSIATDALLAVLNVLVLKYFLFKSQQRNPAKLTA